MVMAFEVAIHLCSLAPIYNAALYPERREGDRSSLPSPATQKKERLREGERERGKGGIHFSSVSQGGFGRAAKSNDS
jgi:hypothetical protein